MYLCDQCSAQCGTAIMQPHHSHKASSIQFRMQHIRAHTHKQAQTPWRMRNANEHFSIFINCDSKLLVSSATATDTYSSQKQLSDARIPGTFKAVEKFAAYFKGNNI